MRNHPASLTARQLRWVDEFLADGNATAAAIRAGYSARSARSIAHENMTKPALKALLAERRGLVASRLQLTREGLVQGFMDAVHLAKEQANPTAMIAGLREVAKVLGYYAPEVKRVEVGLSAMAERKRFEAMSDEELLAHIDELQGAA